MADDKKRKKRRNFAKEFSDLEAYCRISIEVLKQTQAQSDEFKHFMNGQIMAFEKILDKLGVKNG